MFLQSSVYVREIFSIFFKYLRGHEVMPYIQVQWKRTYISIHVWKAFEGLSWMSYVAIFIVPFCTEIDTTHAVCLMSHCRSQNVFHLNFRWSRIIILHHLSFIFQIRTWDMNKADFELCRHFTLDELERKCTHELNWQNRQKDNCFLIWAWRTIKFIDNERSGLKEKKKGGVFTRLQSSAGPSGKHIKQAATALPNPIGQDLFG